MIYLDNSNGNVDIFEDDICFFKELYNFNKYQCIVSNEKLIIIYLKNKGICITYCKNCLM